MSSRRTGSTVRIGLLVGLVLGALCATMPPPVQAQPAAGRGVRTLVLIRHGLYDQDDPRDPEVGRALTAEGREQARLTGARLAAWPDAIDALHASTMTRARETAAIIADSLPDLALRLTRDLRECTPPTERQDIMADLAPGEADSCRSRLDTAFTRFFRPSPDRDSTEILVCHGNVIRYLVCRTLGLDPLAWLRMGIANCSLTVVQVRADGSTRLLSFADAGHLPARWQGLPGARRTASGAAQGK